MLIIKEIFAYKILNILNVSIAVLIDIQVSTARDHNSKMPSLVIQ